MEVNYLVNKILQDIKSSFMKEPNMDEFDIIPVFDSRNKSPVVVEGTKMAMEAWSIKLVWVQVYHDLMHSRENKVQVDDDQIIQWTEVLLLIVPDVTTLWNIRKEYFLKNQINPDEEFRLSRLILSRKPKTSEVFTHRRWILKNHSCKEKLDVINKELLLSSLAAEKYSNNYCAWNHREWIHDNLSDNNLQILLNDLKWNETFVQRHVSDSSGFQFRQYLLKNICTLSNPQQSNCSPVESSSNEKSRTFSLLLKDEWELVTELMKDYKGHEALWYHRRFVINYLHTFHLVDCDINQTSLASFKRPINKKTRIELNHCSNAGNCPTQPFVINLNAEIQFSLEENSMESQQFASNHSRWLAYFFNLDFQ